jgi:phospholipid/cholesterol/gamma-HCH transport system substrate-binding protein
MVGAAEESISDLMPQLLIVAQNLEKASDNLNRVMELLADQPSQLIFGAPPVRREVEAENEIR